jgi:hypothetical protein
MKKNWLSTIGCYASFDTKGILNIFINSKVVLMIPNNPDNNYVIVKADYKYVYIKTNSYFTFFVKKKHCKII